MKELSIEEKAKAYDEAIEKAKKRYNEEYTSTLERSTLAYVFPALKESEDEKIRKYIISSLNSLLYTKGSQADKERNDAIAWLEKQGEQKQDPCKNCKNVRLNCHNFPCIKKRAFEQGKSVLEVINEEKVDNTNKVEPKFHEGDWVVSPNGVYWHIDAINNNRYEVSSVDGTRTDWQLNTRLYHL